VGPYCNVSAESTFNQYATSALPPLWQLLLIILVPSVIVLTCIAYTIHEVRKENGFFEMARKMMTHVGMPKVAPFHHREDEPEARHILPPDNMILSDMVDMAPHHAKHSSDLHEPSRALVLALSEQAMHWPSGTEKTQVHAQKRLRAMLHHDKMPEQKHIKYLLHGPRPSTPAGAHPHDPSSIQLLNMHVHTVASKASKSASGSESPASQASTKSESKDSECFQEIAV